MEQNIKELQNVLQKIKKESEDFPDGTLRISTLRNGRARYYQRKKENETYISKKKDKKLIRQLAQKQYLHQLQTIIQRELSVLEKMQQDYFPENKERVFENLSEERKQLVQPYFRSTEEKYEAWKRENYPVYDAYPESLQYVTDRGEVVRSKSELIIANMLYQQKDVIYYRYEDALELKRSHLTVHPDFTIMSKKKGHLIYWEHAGRMDNMQYADKFVRKVNAYIKEGIFPGIQLIITYETVDVPLDVMVVRKMLRQYFDIVPM